MSCLAPCPACNRHIAINTPDCPFCSAALPDSFRDQHSCRRQPPGRLSRAAIVAAGAVLAAAAASCAGASYGTSPLVDAAAPVDTGTVVDSGTDGGTQD
jgi:hypothetical protein